MDFCTITRQIQFQTDLQYSQAFQLNSEKAWYSLDFIKGPQRYSQEMNKRPTDETTDCSNRCEYKSWFTFRFVTNGLKKLATTDRPANMHVMLILGERCLWSSMSVK